MEFDNSTNSARDGSLRFRGAKSFTFILMIFSPDSKWSAGRKREEQQQLTLLTCLGSLNYMKNVHNQEQC